MDLGRVMGIGRWGIVAGLLITSGGFLLDRPTLAWGGVTVALVALAVNTAGKFVYYARLPITPGRRLGVMAAWLLLAVTIAGLVLDYAYSKLTTGYEGYFWALVIATAGFAAVYWGLRTRYVPAEPGIGE